MHWIPVYADTEQAIRDAAKIAGSLSVHIINGFAKPIGLIEIEKPASRFHLRTSGSVTLIPAKHAISDATQHLSNLGIKGKTARDIHAAVFALTNLDVFDPDF